MTTIAMKDGFIAADYNVSSLGEYFGYKKVIRLRSGQWKGGWAAICGGFYSAMTLVAEIQKESPERRSCDGDDDDTTLLVVPQHGSPFTITWEMTPVPIPRGPFAMGTGAQAAMAAMVCGTSAERAVVVACRLDNDSGLCGKKRPLVVKI